MHPSITLPRSLIAEIEPIIEETQTSLEDFVRQAVTTYLRIIERRKLQAPLECEYDSLADMYDELAAELADETWVPLENEVLLQFERGLEAG